MPIYKMDGKKDGMQKYRVRINYKDSLGNNKQIDRITYGKENAKELEYKLLKEIKKSAPEKSITVAELYEHYISSKKFEVRESTLSKTRQILVNHVLDTLTNKKITQLNMQTLQKWKEHIESKELSLTMKQNIFGEFRTMLNYAVKFDYLNSNPLPKIGNFKDAYETKKEIQFYTADEFLKYIHSAKEKAEENPLNIYEWNYYVFFNIAFYTGLRKGEIHALKWTDIDEELLHVRRSISQKLKGEDRETPPKNKSSFRTLQIPLPLKKVLDEHYKRYSLVDGFTTDWRVCGGESCLRDTTIDKRNKEFARRAELKDIRIHDFRHSHASLLANEGINIQEIARRLGHSKIEITWNTYSHLYPREEERAVKILNKIK